MTGLREQTSRPSSASSAVPEGRSGLPRYDGWSRSARPTPTLALLGADVLPVPKVLQVAVCWSHGLDHRKRLRLPRRVREACRHCAALARELHDGVTRADGRCRRSTVRVGCEQSDTNATISRTANQPHHRSKRRLGAPVRRESGGATHARSALKFREPRKKSNETSHYCVECSEDQRRMFLSPVIRSAQGNTKTCFDIWHQDWKCKKLATANTTIQLRETQAQASAPSARGDG